MSKQASLLSLSDAERQLAKLHAEYSEVSELVRNHDVGEDGDGAGVSQALLMCQAAIRNSIAAIHRRIDGLGSPECCPPSYGG